MSIWSPKTSERARPKWVPGDAVDWGYKVLRLPGRLSPVNVENRQAGCNPVARMNVISYPVNEVIASGFCSCEKPCCEGIHYFYDWDVALAFAMTEPDLSVFGCYVPKGAQLVERGGKRRTNYIVFPCGQNHEKSPPLPDNTWSCSHPEGLMWTGKSGKIHCLLCGL